MVLLKMLLATVSVNNPNQPPPSASSNAFPPGVGSRECTYQTMRITGDSDWDIPAAEQQQPPPPPLTPDEIDLIRHREIMSKAVSAILLLTSRWFKASRKFFPLSEALSPEGNAS